MKALWNKWRTFLTWGEAWLIEHTDPEYIRGQRRKRERKNV